jgi:phosphoglycolate phosphatase
MTKITPEYHAVIFDLDGTLINSLYDIADSMNIVLDSHGFPTHDYDRYRLLIGKGLKNLSENAIPEENRNAETIGKVFEDMIRVYGQNVVNKTVLYKGIPELLDYLQNNGYKIAILSNKAHELTTSIAKKILSKWKIDFILGSKPEIPRKPDPTGAFICSEQLEIEPEYILYLGDSGVDMQTANSAGMTAVGVSWGFRSRQELTENGAKYIIDKPEQLKDLL